MKAVMIGGSKVASAVFTCVRLVAAGAVVAVIGCGGTPEGILDPGSSASGDTGVKGSAAGSIPDGRLDAVEGGAKTSAGNPVEGFAGHRVIRADLLVSAESAKQVRGAERSFEEVISEYGLRSADLADVPPDAILVTVDSPWEIDALAADAALRFGTPTTGDSPRPVTGSSSVMCSKTGLAGVGYAVKLYTRLLRSPGYGPYTVQQATAWTAEEGFALGFTWSQNYAYSVNKALYADSYGGGTLSTWLVIQGGIRLWTQSVTMSLRCYAG